MQAAAVDAPFADEVPGGYVIREANSRDNEDEARQAKVLAKDEADRLQRRAAAGAARRGGRGQKIEG